MVEFSAIIAVFILSGYTLFQILLIAGLPLGHFAWGGYNTILPVKLRIASFIAILLYILFAVIILEKAAIISIIPNDNITSVSSWIITVYLFIGTLMNALSRSKKERVTMTPLAFVLSCLFLFVATK